MVWSRRRFLRFMGAGALSAAGASLPAWLQACAGQRHGKLRPIRPTDADEVLLADGLRYSVLLREGQSLNSRGDRFGKNNDFIAFVPDPTRADSARLWVNHEYPVPLFDGDNLVRRATTAQQAERMMESVGGSLVRIQRNGGEWSFLRDDSNRRWNAHTPIELVAPRPIADSMLALGTMGNCAGGVTPWGTVLSCEENTEDYFGRWDERNGRIVTPSWYGWEQYYPRDPRHYGWVVEIDPRTGKARKLTALGRFSHESATVVEARDGRAVVYSGDDAYDGCIFKFVSDRPGSLEFGRLYAANIPAGRWELLSVERAELKSQYADQLEVLISARRAAWRLQATRCDRPEDIEVDRETGQVYITLTYNSKKLNHHGCILRFTEENDDPRSVRFRSEVFLTGGVSSGFSCPDNMAFDRAGNLWLCTDIAESQMNRGPQKPFANNGLFVIPKRGPGRGRPHQVGSAPRDAEFTGPCFAPDGRTLFLSVQHPGIGSPSIRELHSHWPDGGDSLPRSAVVAIQGPLLEELLEGT